MRKISLLLIAVSSITTAQLRVSLDMNGGVETNLLGIVKIEAKSKMGLRVGYEKALLGLFGVGGEYYMTQLGDVEMKMSSSFMGESDSESETISDKVFPDALIGYGFARIPMGIPMLRGVVRAGMFMPLGEGEIDGESFKFADLYTPALTWGVGVRVKPPLLPIGAELLYQRMKLELDGGVDIDDDVGMFLYGDFSSISLVATYSF